jgi:hypothetical protein
MALRAIDVVLADSAASSLEKLEAKADKDPRSASIARRARALRPVLLADCLHGEVVRRPLPAALVKKHGIENLYVEDLPSFWRLLYTIQREAMRPYVVVIEIVGHETYDKWFPGRGR